MVSEESEESREIKGVIDWVANGLSDQKLWVQPLCEDPYTVSTTYVGTYSSSDNDKFLPKNVVLLRGPPKYKVKGGLAKWTKESLVPFSHNITNEKHPTTTLLLSDNTYYVLVMWYDVILVTFFGSKPISTTPKRMRESSHNDVINHFGK